MIDAYTAWVREFPYSSASLQFALLGTLGELIPWWLRSGKALPCTKSQLLGKVVGWALMGLLIKFGFLMMKGAAAAVIEHGLLPAAFLQGLGWALLVSVLTNCFFGPQMMFFHRLCDNIILRQRHWTGLEKAWWTLIWFWIPAHTLTFLLPDDFQIGLAALWSVVLGVILGATTHKGQR
ncbi:MAG: hypothetical protein Q8O14_07595 [bacterium]|jgi:hypothetical protein|nr:hypothetical protein [bacterium]